MKLITELYSTQVTRWPKTGRHILAQYDDSKIVVYQAYRPEIGRFAAMNGYFGGEFKLTRMSWIKPNFLWMMYRSLWGSKVNQEVILAVSIKKDAFEEILAEAVHSKYVSEIYSTKKDWQKAVKNSQVRLQWDLDRTPGGGPKQRRAIQLGLRSEFLRKYARDWILDIEDISDFVREQYQLVKAGSSEQLITPKEQVYSIADLNVAKKLALSIE
ncbi:MAG: DUF4291 domain-containing protein [Prochloraceae cyanobacterium]